MDLPALSGAVTIALSTAVVFLFIARSWNVVAQRAASTRFPASIMLEAAQRFRDKHANLGREQSIYLSTGLVFAVVFCVFLLLPPRAMFENVPTWQLVVVLVLLLLGAAFVLFRITTIIIARRRLTFMRDANMATGHALQKLTTSLNRVFHDVPCGDGTIDNVIVGLHGVYTVSVIARIPRKPNEVQLKGEHLSFANSEETVPVKQCGARSAQLAREIRKLTGHAVRVRSVISVPGWEVISQESNEYLVVNERNVAMLTGWKEQKDYLMNEDVDAIQKMLTERCTRFH